MFSSVLVAHDADEDKSLFDFELRPILNRDGVLPPIPDVQFEVLVLFNSSVFPSLGSKWEGATQIVLDGMDVCRGTYEGVEFTDEAKKRRFELEVGTAVAEANSFPTAFLRGFTA